MVEQQLIDYIKKARDAGQTDDQTRNLLYKNGWTEAEVSDAITSLDKPQPQVVTQPVVEQPQVVTQAQPQPQIVRQPEPQYQPQSMQSNISQRRGGPHSILKLIMVLIIVAVLGGVGYFTAGQYLNLPYSNFLFNLFKQEDPQTVINNMLENMKNIKSSQTTMQIEINAANKDTKTSIGKLILNTNTETDITDVNNPKANGNFTINLTMPGAASPITATISIAVINKVSYLKINEIKTPAEYSLSVDISKVQGKWLKIDQDSINALNALSKTTGGQTELPDISQMINSNLSKTDLSKKIQDLIATENILSVTKKLSDETISGQSTYHYLITISKEKLNDLSNKIITLGVQETSNLKNDGTTNNSNSALVENMAQAVVKTFVDTIGDINIEIWIGKKDFMLYQTKVEKAIDLGKILESYIGTAATDIGANNIQLELKFNMTNSNFNKPVTVQVPTDAQKIEDVVLPMIKNSGINSDMAQIGSIAQTSYSTNKSYSSICMSGLLNGYLKTYGANLIKLNNDIVSQGAKKPVCFSGIQDYCVSTQLSDGSYLCIDKNGKVGAIKCVTAQTICAPANTVLPQD